LILNAVRVVPMATAALHAIDTHVERFDTTRVRCSCCGKDWYVVFTNEDGELIKSWKFGREVWNPTLVMVKLATGKINGQHNLRHAFGSRR
jgi:site-specific recombinase XerD